MRRLQPVLVATLGGLLVITGCSGPGGASPSDSSSSVPATSNTEPTTGPQPGPSGPPTPGDTGAQVPETPANLTVIVNDDGSQSYHLTCSPTGGDHPRAAAACAQLNRAGPSSLAPPPVGQACTQQYGGAQTATVSGTFGDDPVHATFARTDGCEISRWDSLNELLGHHGT